MQAIVVIYLLTNLACLYSSGYLLRHQDHRTVIGYAVVVNNFFTLLWALTPVDMVYSIHLFIALRFIMGLTQCVMCVFLPLWTNQFAPKDKKTSWMGYLQVFHSTVYLKLKNFITLFIVRRLSIYFLRHQHFLLCSNNNFTTI